MKSGAGFRRRVSAGVQLEAESIRHPRQVVEDTDDVGDFQAGFVIEAQIAQWLPIVLDHFRGRAAELFGHGAQGFLA
ncbi:MAG: hypothetical protein HYT87_13650 [Nitrospirae bacterium]|nr:hypothetical protein [Nitrospirota bacterium]